MTKTLGLIVVGFVLAIVVKMYAPSSVTTALRLS